MIQDETHADVLISKIEDQLKVLRKLCKEPISPKAVEGQVRDIRETLIDVKDILGLEIQPVLTIRLNPFIKFGKSLVKIIKGKTIEKEPVEQEPL